MHDRRRLGRRTACRISAPALLLIATLSGCGSAEWFSGGGKLPNIGLTEPIDSASESDWSGWRGGMHSATTDDFELPDFTAADAQTEWAIDLPCRGNSSPIVVGDRVFLIGELPASEEHELALVCIDRRTGESLWQSHVATGSGPTHQKNGFASATPASDGRRIFVSCGDAGLFCFDLAGQRLWRADLGDITHQWGAASSPIVFRGLVIQLADGENGSHLSAFDAASGQTVWRTERNSRGAWTTPLIASFQTPSDDAISDDDTAPPAANGAALEEAGALEGAWRLIVNGTGNDRGEPGDVIAYDPLNGAEVWRVQGTSDMPCPTALASNGWVISASSNGALGIRATADSARTVWRDPGLGAYVPTGVVYRDRYFSITDSGVASCVRIDTGEIVWRKRFRGTFSASLVAGDGKLFAVSEQGDVQVFATADEFTSLATHRLDEPCLATPAISRGRMFVRTASRLYCFATSDAAGRERSGPSDSTTPSPSDQATDNARGTGENDDL